MCPTAIYNIMSLPYSYLVGLGILKTFIEASTGGIFDTFTVTVLLVGLLGILKYGKSAPPPNPYALMIAKSPDLGTCYYHYNSNNTFMFYGIILGCLVEKIDDLRKHENFHVQDHVRNIMDLYVAPAAKLINEEAVEKMKDGNMNVNAFHS